ncbi:MAG: flagellin lysine-N-methylase [Thiohalospira sp.]
MADNSATTPCRVPRYIHDFRCIGPDCEMPCCGGFEINLDARDHAVLQDFTRHDPGDRRRFAAGVEYPAEEGAPVARLRLDDRGMCHFYEDEGWCRVHRRHGERALPGHCARYPRVIHRHPATTEVSGALSCPEVVRGSLLEEGGNRLTPARAEEFILDSRSGHQPGRTAYARYLIPVRAALAEVVPTGGHGLAEGLFTAAYLAARLAPFYHADCGEPEPMLGNVLRRRHDASVAETLRHRLATAEEDHRGLLLAQAALLLVRDQSPETPLGRIIAAAWEALAAAGEPVTDRGLEGDELAAALRQRRARVRHGLDERMDTWLARWFHNTLFREPFTSLPDPFRAVQLMALRLSTLRLLLHLDPVLLAAAEAGDGEAVAARFTILVARFARQVDHNTDFLVLLYRAAEAEGLMNLDATPGLVRT